MAADPAFGAPSGEAERTHPRICCASSPRAAQYAVLDTRQAKDDAVEASALKTRWTEQAAGIGWDVGQFDEVLGQACPVDLTPERIEQIGKQLLGPDGLTGQASIFDRRAVLRAWCDHLSEGADITTVEALADQTLTYPQVVPLAPDDLGPVGTMRHQTTGKAINTPGTGTRFSTQDLLALETRLVETVTVPDNYSNYFCWSAVPGTGFEPVRPRGDRRV